MDVKYLFAGIGAILAFIGNISYLRAVIKGTIEPHPYTWFIWSIVSMTTFFGGIAKGAGIGALPTGVAEAFTLIIFFVSLRNLLGGKIGHIKAIDHFFLLIALLGLIPWAITKDPTISVCIVVAIDGVAFIPTIRKAWVHPDTERPTLYQMNIARHILTLFSLRAYNVATTIHSIVMICTNTIMTWCISRSSTKK